MYKPIISNYVEPLKKGLFVLQGYICDLLDPTRMTKIEQKALGMCGHELLWTGFVLFLLINLDEFI